MALFPAGKSDFSLFEIVETGSGDQPTLMYHLHKTLRLRINAAINFLFRVCLKGERR